MPIFKHYEFGTQRVPNLAFLIRRMVSANLGVVNLAVADRQISKPSIS